MIDIVKFLIKIILLIRKSPQSLTLAIKFFLNKILGRHFKVLLFVAKNKLTKNILLEKRKRIKLQGFIEHKFHYC